MCGIFGWALTMARRQSRQTLIELTDSLAHRAPDNSGYVMNDSADGQFQIALGHRRLSIIDVTGGLQPMSSQDRSITLTFNGEIYNYIELRDELKARGHQFHTDSDTEVVLEAYRAWGIDALPRFRGMFAFALWDQAI
jgi:asparagine synthase (glutamine-hydrolysing)